MPPGSSAVGFHIVRNPDPSARPAYSPSTVSDASKSADVLRNFWKSACRSNMNTGSLPTNRFSLGGTLNCLLTARFAPSRLPLRKSASRASQSVKIRKWSVSNVWNSTPMSRDARSANARARSIAAADSSGVAGS